MYNCRYSDAYASAYADNEIIASNMLQDAIDSKQALRCLQAMVKAQGGDEAYIKHPGLFPKTEEVISIRSHSTGYIKSLNALSLGIVSMKLGGGRMVKEDSIDYSVGLVLNKKIGDFVSKDDILVKVFTNTGLDSELEDRIYAAYEIVDGYVNKPVLVEEIMKKYF